MERLELDYVQTTELIRTLVDVRFKLIALVPTLTGGAVAVLSHAPTPGRLLAVGAIGLVATLGILLYEIRNTEIHDYAIHRARELEGLLGQTAVLGRSPGGLYRERPARGIQVFGVALAAHDRGLALVYGAALGGWAYLVAWGAVRALDLGQAQRIGGVVGVLVGLAVALEVLRIDTRAGKSGAREAGSTRPPTLAQPGSPNA